ncbi:hypothetical protein B0O80DRAFT_528617 [Mortierella sp. GBAus27b]|nr:hypothetical protein BGX31_000621 [Mortierella sp. GBA43]KAI8355404.1 hypothetical protein B0O80DRAFT_528617 [Mortierella sp. GBAus27b]
MTTSAAFRGSNPSSSLLSDQDDGDFVGVLFDTILYERACKRHSQKRHDFPLRYDELAHDFLTAYRLCLEPKFLANQNTASFAQRILQSKLLTAKGVRAYVLEHGGFYEIFPTDDNGDFLSGSQEVEELNEDAFSDYDDVDQGMSPVRRNVGYQGPMLIQRQRRSAQGMDGPQQSVEGQAYQEEFARGYFAIWKHSQDMIAAIIAHLRRRVWYHDGSGGEIIDIDNMGVDGKPKHAATKSTETDSSSTAKHPNKKNNGRIQGEDNDDQEMSVDGPPKVQEIKGVKGVKKYTRRFNGKQKRRNYERAKARSTQTGFWQPMDDHNDPPTDYTDSEDESRVAGQDPMDIEAAIERLAAMSIQEYTGSAKRQTHWLQSITSERLYDSEGVNKELRLIDLPTEEEDPTFYGRLTRDIMIKYKTLLPPPDLTGKHKRLKEKLESVIKEAFRGEDIQVEAYGSFVSGLLLANSDADFCINGPNVHNHQLLNDMHYLAELFKNTGRMESVMAVPDAMVPIVKFRDPETKIECDLNTGNNLGVINSELIKVYTGIDERVKPFLYMIKAICKAQGINDSRSGYLSSYAITWMGIVYLQQESQSAPSGSVWGWGSSPVLPKLQLQPIERMREITLRTNHNTKGVVTSTTSLVNSKQSDMVHCRYDDNNDGKHTGSGRENKKSLARLLIDFFEYFSRHFNYVETAIHVARAQFVQKTNRDMHNESSRLATFRVVDPFLHHRNITGTCRGDTLARVWRAFDHSYRMLSAGDLEGAMVTVE